LIKETLTDLGYKLTDNGDHWRTSALFRNGENEASVQIYKDTGVWIDYGGDNEYRPIEDLLDESGFNGKFDFKPKDNKEQKALISMIEKTFTEKSLDRLVPNFSFYMDRGISEHTLKFFKGGVAMSGQLYGRFVFPIYKRNNLINGFSGRDIMDRDKAPKWKHFCNRKGFVYPFFIPNEEGDLEISDKIEKTKQVILMESIGDALSCYENGIKNIGVTFGLNASPALRCHLMSLDLDSVIISSNNDTDKEVNAGLCSAVKTFLSLSQIMDPSKIFICLPNKNDFGCMNKLDFSKWSKKKEETIKNGPQIKKVIKLAEEMISKKQIPKKYSKVICQIQ
tara:strand:+ start:15233 stop:16243 length:1011 start_codon:yes stop_codon:yes gene_type:complete